MHKTLLSLVAAAALLLTGCGVPPASSDFERVEDGIEFEDCDAEDARNGERECSRRQIDKARGITVPKVRKPSTTRQKPSGTSRQAPRPAAPAPRPAPPRSK